MAYPTVSKPYGLQPINLIGGQVFAGSTRQMKIASGYAANIFTGDVVKLVSTGVIEKDTGTTTATPVGVFVGCQFTNPSTKQVQFQQYWPTGTVASDAVAFVVDDPDILFKVAAVSATTTVAFYAQTVVGNNVALVQNAGSTTTGDSAVAIDGTSAATTATLPIRIVAGVPDTANSSGEFCEFICKWNAPSAAITIDFTAETASVSLAGGHQYLNPTGV
jgi:uncharacterized protein (UPF0333 family)